MKQTKYTKLIFSWDRKKYVSLSSCEIRTGHLSSGHSSPWDCQPPDWLSHVFTLPFQLQLPIFLFYHFLGVAIFRVFSDS
jgi:hypothetical protein